MITSPQKFMDYFAEIVQHPTDIMFNLLPVGTCYQCVASWLLACFVKYVVIEKAYVLNNYIDWDEDPMVEIKVRAKISSAWETIQPKTKIELFDLLTSRESHNIVDNTADSFCDNILILASATSDDLVKRKMWVYFFYDQDVSECSIGRFTTTDSDSEVIEAFSQLAKEIGKGEEKEIPRRYYDGDTGMHFSF